MCKYFIIEKKYPFTSTVLNLLGSNLSENILKYTKYFVLSWVTGKFPPVKLPPGRLPPNKFPHLLGLGLGLGAIYRGSIFHGAIFLVPSQENYFLRIHKIYTIFSNYVKASSKIGSFLLMIS